MARTDRRNLTLPALIPGWMADMLESAWHPVRNKHAIEWWYFLLLCDDGEIYNGRLWVKGDYRRSMKTGIDLYAYPIEGVSWERHSRFEHDSFYAERDRVSVRVEANLLELEREKLLLKIRTDDVSLQVEAQSLLQLDESVIRQHIDRTHGFVWTIPVLKGRFEGRIKSDEHVEKAISGIIFHDHVLADIAPTLDMLRNYRGWCWGLVYCQDLTCLFLQVDFKRAPLYHSFIVDEGRVSRVSSERPLETVQCLTGIPPAFIVNMRGQRSEVQLNAVHHLGQTSERSRIVDRIVNAVAGISKFHGSGFVDEGLFYFEMLIMSRFHR